MGYRTYLPKRRRWLPRRKWTSALAFIAVGIIWAFLAFNKGPGVRVGMTVGEVRSRKGPPDLVWTDENVPDVVMTFGPADIRNRPIQNKNYVFVYRVSKSESILVFFDNNETVWLVNAGGA